ncbi:YdcF family protein [Patescibacteria group bacterium]|nr:YdcF family protein [Patescibacteria group bacterium]
MRPASTLPTTHELGQIMDFEAKRPLPPEKESVHYPNLTVFTDLLAYFGMDTSLVTNDYSPEEVLEQALLEKADTLLQELIARILETKGTGCRSLLDTTYDYLSEEDPLEKADAIFVFGAKTPLRAEKATQLYKDDWSKKIVFSGHGPFSGRENITEAEIYRNLAIAAGVPTEDILLETRSITIPDNVRSSLNLFDEIGFKPRCLIIVSSPYAQRRGWCLFKKYTSDDLKIIRQNCGTAEKYSREGWFTNQEGLKVVLNEFIKMKFAASLNTA